MGKFRSSDIHNLSQPELLRCLLGNCAIFYLYQIRLNNVYDAPYIKSNAS